MADLSTAYMGIPLKNPIIAGASGMTANMDSIKRLEMAGVAALVTKSLFEEEIQLEHFKFDEDQEKYNYRNPEMITVTPHLSFGKAAEHIMWVRKTKAEVSIPVIASLNAVNRDVWIEYAVRLQETGVDGLECNFFASPLDAGRSASDVEDEQVGILEEMKGQVSIPISVKLSPFYTNPLNVAQRMADAGADAVVLFNRMFEPDIDVNHGTTTSPWNFSFETDYRLSMRYAGLMEGAVHADLCCSTGIYNGQTAVKMVLAGAACVQVVSAVYKEGFSLISAMLKEMERWMDEKGYQGIPDFRGKMSRQHVLDPWAYTRTQYARLLMNPDIIIKNVPAV
jgi:dihydroorotate dehydrogenase (fumarate)